MARQIDPWGGMDSMLRVLNDMEYRRDKAKETKMNRMMAFLAEQQEMQDARTERNVSALETAWRNAKSPAQRGLHQAKAKNLVGRNPRLRNRLSNITGGILDLNREAAENYRKYNQVPPIDPSITWESDFVAKSRHEFTKRHHEDRARWIAGGKQGNLNLTKMIEYGTTEGEGGTRTREFATFDDSGSINLYGSTNKNDMYIQTEAKKMGMKPGEFLSAASGAGTVSKDMGIAQINGEQYKAVKETAIYGKNRGLSTTRFVGLPANIKAQKQLKTLVMEIHEDNTPTERLPKEYRRARQFLDKLQDYYKYQNSKDPNEIVAARAADAYMQQVSPNETAVLLRPGKEEKGSTEFWNWFPPTGIAQGLYTSAFGGRRDQTNDWVKGETEAIMYVPGSRIKLPDKTGTQWNFIYDKLTGRITDSSGRKIGMYHPSKSGEFLEFGMDTLPEVSSWLSSVDYASLKSGKTKASVPAGTLYSKGAEAAAAQGIEPVTTIGEYQIGQSGEDEFFIRRQGEGWRLPKNRAEIQAIRNAVFEQVSPFGSFKRGKQ